MPPAIATIVYSLLIPVVWVSLACSRSPGQWLQMNAVPSPDQVLEGSPFDRLAYMLLLAAGLIVLVTRGQRVGKFLRANAVVLLFFLYCAVSILWSDYPDVAFKRWTKALGDFVMILVVLSDRDPSAAVKRLLARTTYILIPLSILFIEYYPKIGMVYDVGNHKAYYTGVSEDKNNMGVVCLLFGLGAVWRLLADYQAR